MQRPLQTCVITISSPALRSPLYLTSVDFSLSGKNIFKVTNDLVFSPFSSSPSLPHCRFALCQISLRSVLHGQSQTQLIARSQRGKQACRLQTPSTATITATATILGLCDRVLTLGWILQTPNLCDRFRCRGTTKTVQSAVLCLGNNLGCLCRLPPVLELLNIFSLCDLCNQPIVFLFERNLGMWCVAFGSFPLYQPLTAPLD